MLKIESHVKYRTSYDVEKKTDRNHATGTLGNRLYTAKKTFKGLTSVVISYILKLFASCISLNQEERQKIRDGLKVLVCTLFQIILNATLIGAELSAIPKVTGSKTY